MRKGLLLVLCACCAWLQSVTAAELEWFDGQHPVTYSLPKRVEPVVKVALDLFKRDLQQVTGLVPVASDKPVVKVLKGKVAPDGFRIYVKDGQIVVEGGNGRGMAYGLLELSRLAGVSPWVWWGDIVPERKTPAATEGQHDMACDA